MRPEPLVEEDVWVVATRAQSRRLAASMITAKLLATRTAGTSSYPRDRLVPPET